MANYVLSDKKVRLDSVNIKTYANMAVKVLRDAEPEKVSKAELCEKLGLTIGQGSKLIKYMRRCSLSDFEKYIPYYPISSKKGYSLPNDYKEFLPCFATLYLWSNSLARTIVPMEKKLTQIGVDWFEYINNMPKFDSEDFEYEAIEDKDNYLFESDEINKNTSWFFEKEDN